MNDMRHMDDEDRGLFDVEITSAIIGLRHTLNNYGCVQTIRQLQGIEDARYKILENDFDHLVDNGVNVLDAIRIVLADQDGN